MYNDAGFLLNETTLQINDTHYIILGVNITIYPTRILNLNLVHRIPVSVLTETS